MKGYRRLPDDTDCDVLTTYAEKILTGEKDGYVKNNTSDDVELHIAFGENVFLARHEGSIKIANLLNVWLPIPPFKHGDLVRVRENKYHPWLIRHFKNVHREVMVFYTLEDGEEIEYNECIAVC